MALQHWVRFGKDEGRHWRLKNVDYQRVSETLRQFSREDHAGSSSRDFLMITSLYNETAPLRRREYLSALEHNLELSAFSRIVVLYDIDRDTGSDDLFGHLPPHPKLDVRKISGRPSFAYLISLGNTEAKDMTAIANADIAFTPDLAKVPELGQSVLAVTRWEFVDEDRISVKHVGGRVNEESIDTWLFEKGLQAPEELADIRLGTPACDGYLSLYFSGRVFNPCWDIRTLHIHFQGGRVGDYVNIPKVDATSPVVSLADLY